MQKELYEREKNYRALIAITRQLLNNGILSAPDYDRIDRKLCEIYRPMCAKLMDGAVTCPTITH